MSTITKENFEQHIEGYVKIHDAVEQLANDFVNNFGSSREYVSSFEIEYDGFFGTILIDTEASNCGCCGPDYGSYSIPLAYIFDSDWVKTETDKRAEQKRKLKEEQAAKAAIQKKEKAIQDAERKKKLEAERYQDFLKMKEEYESK